MKRLKPRDSVMAVAIAVAVSVLIQWSNAMNVSAAGAKPAEKPAEQLEPRMKASVKNCHDGDTCRVVTETGHMWMNVRLAGVDAPETANRHKKSKGQPMGEAALDFVNAQISGKSVELEQVDLDGYNRPVVVIWQGEKNFNLTLIEEGLAEAYRGPVKRIDQETYIKAEGRAKTAAKGIWGLPANERQSPAEYRKQIRQQQPPGSR